jgi:restriction system protein
VLARAEFDAATLAWRERTTQMRSEHVAALEQRERTEAARVMKLALAKTAYDEECRQREVDAQAHNEELTTLVNDLTVDVESAISSIRGDRAVELGLSRCVPGQS